MLRRNPRRYHNMPCRACTELGKSLSKTYLSRTQAGPDRAVKEQHKQTSPNHVQWLFLSSVSKSKVEAKTTRRLVNHRPSLGWILSLNKVSIASMGLHHTLLEIFFIDLCGSSINSVSLLLFRGRPPALPINIAASNSQAQVRGRSRNLQSVRVAISGKSRTSQSIFSYG